MIINPLNTYSSNYIENLECIKLSAFRCRSPWYGRVSVVSEMPRKKTRGIKEFYPKPGGSNTPTEIIQ
jgi:hypothetical protein